MSKDVYVDLHREEYLNAMRIELFSQRGLAKRGLQFPDKKASSMVMNLVSGAESVSTISNRRLIMASPDEITIDPNTGFEVRGNRFVIAKRV